jgi:DNA polymerase I-like protein with 3'-5' exonuclease and polymerase domains
MRRLVFDCETDGLLPELTKVHCIGTIDVDTGEQTSEHTPEGIKSTLRELMDADVIVGHNIIGFDIPAIQKVYPWFRPRGIVRDTYVLSTLMHPHIAESDFERAHKNTLPKKHIGSHSLAAWGFRLGELKAEYEGGWLKYSEEMRRYMDQDVVVTKKLLSSFERTASEWGIDIYDDHPSPGKDCVDLEHRVASIVFQVEKTGMRFDRPAAVALAAKLSARKQELTDELQKRFPPRKVTETFIPKVNNKKRGYVKGLPFEKEWTVAFNPASRQEVARRLQGLGWKPAAYGKDGTPTVDEDILSTLPYPEAKLLSEFYVVDKRLGQIVHGQEAWFRHEHNGRIHGRIRSNGAHTGRMTHSRPNLAQVPANHAPYGEECRACFISDEGYTMVGCDADALELRDLAGYMAHWDNGAYIETVLRGDKAQGTDMHTLNAKAIGCDRDTAKTFFYAMIYGSGEANLGSVIGSKSRSARADGAAAKARLMAGVPALGRLVRAVSSKIEKRGYLVGLDGRRLYTRSQNAALNTLLQGAGAVQMKRGLVILCDSLTQAGYEWGRDYAIVGLIHDEWQAYVKPELVETYGNAAVQAIRAAGKFYDFKCPLDGQWKGGANWKETH